MDDPTDHAPSTGRDSAAELARLRRQHPGWHITRGTGSDPLGFAASCDGTLITSPSLDRLADLLAGADGGPGMLP